MAYISNEDKMLEAVLLNERLMQAGGYTAADIGSLYAALTSDNYIINTVAQIIKGTKEGVSDSALWRQVNDYLKRNV